MLYLGRILVSYGMDSQPEEQTPETRLFGGEAYQLFWSGPRVVVEGLYRKLLEHKIPARLETMMSEPSLPEFYMGINFGETTLWVAAEYVPKANHLIEKGEE